MNHTTSPTAAYPETLLDRLLHPIRRFIQAETSSGIVLLSAAVLAMILANTGAAAAYFQLWDVQLTVGGESFGLTQPLHAWINDGLMVIFFFLVGLEIKRELLVGQLASVRQAALPITAAIGGMIVPASLFAIFNAGSESAAGWGIPMATDIAFAIGVLALLGNRVPLGVKVFLTAFAIVDDLGAVLVIAFFYTSDLALGALGVAAVVMALLVAANKLGVRHPAVYTLLGIVLWLAFLQSGVHATVAGVLLAMAVPARTRIDAERFVTESRARLDEFEKAGPVGGAILPNPAQQATLDAIEAGAQDVQAPLQRMEHKLQAFVGFLIMPVFAFANAGVAVEGSLMEVLTQPVAMGIALGLILGKPIGVTFFSWLAIRTGLAVIPAGTGMRHIVGAGMIGGIGFTMSLFIAELAFAGTAFLETAKLGILMASLTAGIIGYLFLRATPPAARTEEVEQTEKEMAPAGV